MISEKIHAVHQAINPGIFLSDSDNLKQIAVNTGAAVGSKVKSLFTEGLGKRRSLHLLNFAVPAVVNLVTTKSNEGHHQECHSGLKGSN